MEVAHLAGSLACHSFSVITGVHLYFVHTWNGFTVPFQNRSVEVLVRVHTKHEINNNKVSIVPVTGQSYV